MTTSHVLQARVEVLRDGAVSPPDYLQCRFEVVHKNHYIERNNFMAVLAKCGIAADDNDDSQEDDVFLRLGRGTFRFLILLLHVLLLRLPPLPAKARIDQHVTIA